MTDKVQKILSEITTRKLCTMDEHMAFYNDKAKEDYRLLSDIEEFIKALQEEPSKFDAAIQEDDDVRYNEDLGCRVNLSRLKRVAKKEEPVSENLEEAAKDYSNNLDNICGSVGEQTRNAFKAGAKWQKEQMMAKAVDAKLLEGHLIRQKGVTHPLYIGDKVKVIVIKED